ncbi:hypothetical protein B0T18DRAFT_432711 [Schizothecium vesticola]|uniref:ABM domain-containing protein n=1 Tax=Schizothecium vesticola TaxID=314040 RepID=A0AA40EIE9_9PEZI|nr:hypothetical protein B0T18DRAFT_432711 [Schizothecium vesticola]
MATDFQLPVVPEDEFAVYGKVYAFPQHADALEAVYRETTILSASETGILHYCISRDADDPAIFHFFERYTGRDAFDAHNSQPIIQKLLNVDRYIKHVEAVIAKPV